MSLVLAIDPGTTASAYVIVDAALRPVEFGKVSNELLLRCIEDAPCSRMRWGELTACAIEMPAYAMLSGVEVYTTCRWLGNFEHAWRFCWEHETRWSAEAIGRGEQLTLITRHQVKMHLLGRASRLGSGADS